VVVARLRSISCFLENEGGKAIKSKDIDTEPKRPVKPKG